MPPLPDAAPSERRIPASCCRANRRFLTAAARIDIGTAATARALQTNVDTQISGELTW
jgi:hypothetical protein